MICMTVARSAATVMLEEVRSVMTWSVPLARGAAAQAVPRSSPLEQVRHAAGAEVADVDALGRADPDAALERLVHVAEQDVPGLRRSDQIEQGFAPPFHPPGHCVVEELGHGWRDVSAEHVDVAYCGNLRREHVIIELVGGAVGRLQPAADKSERPPVELDPLAVKDALTRTDVRVPEPR